MLLFPENPVILSNLFSGWYRNSPKGKVLLEQIKAENSMEWMRQMNNICSRVTDVVNTEEVFVCENANIIFGKLELNTTF